ncbi:MAG: hypothetical protein IPJ82_05800 [Lewinellaceae bacterium]|nr:hypothetical protein [Lewinellaceae bacterium]
MLALPYPFARFGITFFGLLAMATAWPLAAQEYIAKVQYYNIDQGLSHRQVNAICQDRHGFVWIGTLNGLNRFDGYSFRPYTKEKDGLPFNNILTVAEDTEGWLWLQGQEGQKQGLKEICLFHPERGEIRSLPEKFGTSAPEFSETPLNLYIRRDDEGVMWMSARDTNLLFLYHPANGVQALQIAGLRNIIPVYFTPDKTIWARADDHKMVLLDRSGKVLKLIENSWLYGNWSISDKGLLTITKPAGGKEKLIFYNLKGEKQPYTPAGLTDANAPHPALIVPFGNDGTFIIHNRLVDPAGVEIAAWDFSKHDRNNFMWRSFMQDNTGRYWLGDDFGFYILQIKKNRFKRYFYTKDIKPGQGFTIRGILAAQGKLYANLERNGCFELDLRSGQSHRLEATGSGWSYHALLFAKNGDILIGKQDALLRFNPGANSVLKFPIDSEVWGICEDNTGKLWVGTLKKGLYTCPPGATSLAPYTQYNNFRELSTALVHYIEQDKSGTLWACAGNGFYQIDPQKGVVARYWSGGTGASFLPALNFLHFCIDADGVFWFATATGLVRAASQTGSDGRRYPVWSEKTGKWYNRANSLSNDFIYAVHEDKQGKLWMPTDNGIIRLDKKTGEAKPITFPTA